MISNSGRSVLLHTSGGREERLTVAVETEAKDQTSTCDGLGVPAVGRRRVELAELALAHILLFGDAPLVGLGVRVRVQVKGRGGQLGSPLTSQETKGLMGIGEAETWRRPGARRSRRRPQMLDVT